MRGNPRKPSWKTRWRGHASRHIPSMNVMERILRWIEQTFHIGEIEYEIENGS